MDHAHIDANGIVERYAMGRLSADEQRDFETHLLDCHRCADALEDVHLLRAGLTLADASAGRGARARGPAQWLAGLLLTRPGVATAALALVALLPAGAVWWQAGGDAPAGVRADARVLALAPVRSANDRPAYQVRLGEAPFPLVALLETEPADCDHYSVSLLGPSGSPLWGGEGLKLDGYGTVPLVLDSSLLAPGDYDFELRTAADCATPDRPVARYGLRVVP